MDTLRQMRERPNIRRIQQRIRGLRERMCSRRQAVRMGVSQVRVGDTISPILTAEMTCFISESFSSKKSSFCPGSCQRQLSGRSPARKLAQACITI